MVPAGGGIVEIPKVERNYVDCCAWSILDYVFASRTLMLMTWSPLSSNDQDLLYSFLLLILPPKEQKSFRRYEILQHKVTVLLLYCAMLLHMRSNKGQDGEDALGLISVR